MDWKAEKRRLMQKQYIQDQAKSAAVPSIAEYRAFIARKSQYTDESGFTPLWIPAFLFDFQAALVEWAIRKGRAAIFADCGLGKTPMQLVWAENIVRRENKPVLILTPLAVSAQTMREAEKFGIECHLSRDGSVNPGINITNYERLHYFTPGDFIGCVCDESSILKNFDGRRRRQITEFMHKMPYRLLCTATAAPNDYVEMGTSSQALGYLDYSEMLAAFFKNEEKLSEAARRGRRTREGLTLPKWLFKGHAEEPFWRWVCSWARAIRRPSDLGFDDGDFLLPDLIQREHLTQASRLPDGKLIHVAAVSFREQIEERRLNLAERCEKVAELVAHDRPALVWCHLNPEGNYLEKLIPGAVQVSGADADDAKEEKFLAFASGKVRVLVTKPKIGAWGLNFQHCAHMTFFPSHSFEQYYQGVRRCWRFGQTRPVLVDIITTEAERDVSKSLKRKEAAADKMFGQLVANMRQSLAVESINPFRLPEEIPAWL